MVGFFVPSNREVEDTNSINYQLTAVTFLCVIAATIDAVSTTTCVQIAGTTAIELNPVARSFMTTMGPWGQLPQKVAAITLTTLLAMLVTRNRKQAALLTLSILTLAQTAAAFNNCYHIWKFAAPYTHG